MPVKTFFKPKIAISFNRIQEINLQIGLKLSRNTYKYLTLHHNAKHSNRNAVM